jgi:hypothetical protein
MMKDYRMLLLLVFNAELEAPGNTIRGGVVDKKKGEIKTT